MGYSKGNGLRFQYLILATKAPGRKETQRDFILRIKNLYGKRFLLGSFPGAITDRTACRG